MPSLSSLASSLGSSTIGERTSHVAIQEYDENDDQTGPALRFQYFPETISDSKAVNWSPKEIPGGSLPIYQWISSGERAISFTAVFSTDVDFSIEGQGPSESAALWERLKQAGEGARNVDIRSAILWLRRFTMPRYVIDSAVQVGTPLTRAPRKLQLHMPGSGIGLAHGGLSGLHDGQDFITAIMTGCEVTWVQFFPSGFPRIATVGLSFAQIAQFKGMISFSSPTPDIDATVYSTNGSQKVYQYSLQGRSGKK